MSEDRESNPLVERVDALLRRHKDETLKSEETVPVLTEIVDPGSSRSAAPRGADALGAEIERAVLEQLAPEIEALVRRAVREAVARALAVRAPDDRDT